MRPTANLQIKFKEHRRVPRSFDPVKEKEAKDVTARIMNLPVEGDRTPQVWKAQKPRMSSARIMMEVRRRLWIEASSPNTGTYRTDECIRLIRALNKRIEKRVVIEGEAMTRNEYAILQKLLF